MVHARIKFFSDTYTLSQIFWLYFEHVSWRRTFRKNAACLCKSATPKFLFLFISSWFLFGNKTKIRRFFEVFVRYFFFPNFRHEFLIFCRADFWAYVGILSVNWAINNNNMNCNTTGSVDCKVSTFSICIFLNCVPFKVPSWPDWICMRVVPLDSLENDFNR